MTVIYIITLEKSLDKYLGGSYWQKVSIGSGNGLGLYSLCGATNYADHILGWFTTNLQVNRKRELIN